MSVFNLFSLLVASTTAIMSEGTKHVNSKNDNLLREKAIKRGDNKYYDKDGILHDTVLNYELVYIDDTPGYSGYYTDKYTKKYVLGCREHNRFFEIQSEASHLNKKYFVVNVMDYFNRDLYTEDTLFFIVENKRYGIMYRVCYNNKITNVTSFYKKYKDSALYYSKESFTPDHKWLTEILINSYIPNDIKKLSTFNFMINGIALIPHEKFQGYVIYDYDKNIVTGYHILGSTYHGYLNRIKIEKIINSYVSGSYDLNEIINNLKDIITEEEFYNNHSKHLIEDYQKIFKMAIETMRNDINILNGIMNGNINGNELDNVIEHLKEIIM